MSLKPIKLMFLGMFTFVQAQAVIPAGYYDGADGLKKVELKTKLYNIIKDHTVLTYTDLWTAFRTTDVRADGKVWDIYSKTTNFVFGTNQDSGSGGSTEGEFYNREHSFPNSWFGGLKDSPMYTDLFHMYPSDKWVNNKRGNMPFGNVQAVTGFSANHYCEWGSSTESGSSLTVFEPADELKGDMARTYFYMVTRYENLVAGWKSNANTEMLGGNSYPAFSAWALNVLLEWSRLDPVSAKERARNEVIYANFQHNRNPFIDFPSLAEFVWGDSVTYAFHPSKYVALAAEKKVNKRLNAWRVKDEIHVRTIPGKEIEFIDATGIVCFHGMAETAEYVFRHPQHDFILIRVDNEVVKVVM